MSITCSNKAAALTSSSVERNADTSPWGSSRMKPTVSESTTGPNPSISTRLIVGSSVAKSLSAVYTPAAVRRLNSEDFPAFV